MYYLDIVKYVLSGHSDVKYVLSGHSDTQEIKHFWKFTSGFIGPQILNFDISLSLSPGPKSSLDPSGKTSRGGPGEVHKAHSSSEIFSHNFVQTQTKSWKFILWGSIANFVFFFIVKWLSQWNIIIWKMDRSLLLLKNSFAQNQDANMILLQCQ